MNFQHKKSSVNILSKKQGTNEIHELITGRDITGFSAFKKKSTPLRCALKENYIQLCFTASTIFFLFKLLGCIHTMLVVQRF